MKVIDDRRTDRDTRLTVVAGHLNAVNAQVVGLVAEVLADGSWDDRGHRSPAAFVAWKLGLSPERAAVIVAVARRRHDFPVLFAAFERGELSIEQVAEATKAPAWADALILEFCLIATPAKIRRAMRSNLFEHDPDEPAPEPAAVRDRVSFGVGRDGRWRIRGELGIDEGRRVEATLSERKDDLYTQRDDHTGSGRDRVTWAEAFVDCFDRSLGAVESVSRRDHYRTWLHVDVTDGTATTTDGWRIPIAIQQHLLCDGIVQPVWERDGIPFSVGRSQRIVPERTRHIVEHRDRGCRVPGCTSKFVEIHHIIHWLDGGPTDTWNLVSVCPWHHKLHHQGLLGISGNADQFDGLVFTDRDHTPIPGVGPPTPPTTPPPSPTVRYESPLIGRFDWNWIGLGWIHPNARRIHLQHMTEHWNRHTNHTTAA